MTFALRMKTLLHPPAAIFLIVFIGIFTSSADAQILGSGDHVPGLINNEATITFAPKERPLADVLDHISDVVGVNILLAPGVEETVSLKLTEVPWRDALEIVAEKSGCIVIEKSPRIFRVEKPPRVTFTFLEEDIKTVINAIAQSANADVIIAPEVQGNVNMHVDNIPWKDALVNVIKTMGYRMVEEDRGVLRVVTPESLEQQLETRVFELKYLRPRNVYVPIIKSEYLTGDNKAAEGEVRKDFPLLNAVESLLSESGKLDYFPKDNVIFVKDIKPVLDKIAEILDRLDQEPLQVLINVQFIRVQKDDNYDASFGFANVDGSGIYASMTGASRTSAFPFNMGKGSFADTMLPGPAPNIDINNWTPVPDVTPGILDFSAIQFLVNLMQVSTHTHVSQNPSVVTLDHHEATINVGDSIRWAMIESDQSQSGGVSYTIKEADGSPVHVGFQLFITPHIIPGSNKIILAVIPKDDQLSGNTTNPELLGFDEFNLTAQSEDFSMYLPRVRSQTIVTNLLLESGQTGVIGGLVTSKRTEINSKIPFLGDIPILGYLFKATSSISVDEDLIVMITPQIIEGGAHQATEEVERMRASLQEGQNVDEWDAMIGDVDVED